MRRSIIAISILIFIALFMPKLYIEENRECDCIGFKNANFCYGIVRECICLKNNLYSGCQDYTDNILVVGNELQVYLEGYQDCEYIRINNVSTQECHPCEKMEKPFRIPIDQKGEVLVEFDYYTDSLCKNKQIFTQRLKI